MTKVIPISGTTTTPTPNLPIKLKCYSLPELAKLYTVHRDTFRKWLTPFAAEIGERQGRFYNINQVKIILDKLGWPDAEAFES